MMCKRQGPRTQARVLVADWDQANAFALAAILQRAGFKVITACDGKEAVTMADAFTPDLFITEPYLGRLSGINAAVQITAALPGCRVLFLSGEASMADIARSAPVELVYSHTAKPIHPLDLLNIVAYLICAEWSSEESAPTATDGTSQNPAAQEPAQPSASAPPGSKQLEETKSASLALNSCGSYFTWLLALKREHAETFKTIRPEPAHA